MRRKFSRVQREILRLIAGNKCGICLKILNEGFHADHVKPYSRGGFTTIRNGMALCPSCNLRKADKFD
jgi:5-methylcytosine-specific restriction endonuclease McrA